MIESNSTIKRNEEKFLSSQVGQEIMIMDLENGNYISLNPTGTLIWESIKEPIVINDLIAKLLKLSDASEKDCKTDTLEFLERLNRQEMIIIE